MQALTDALSLLTRQAEPETAMKQLGGIRVTEEHDLHVVHGQLRQFPEAMQAVIQAACAPRRPVTGLTVHDVESRATAGRAS